MHQTVGAITLPDGFRDEEVVSGLDKPVGFAFLPDGRIVVIEQDRGRLYVVVDGTFDPEAPLWDIPEVDPHHWERGLLGIAVDPRFPGQPYLYLYFSNATSASNDLIRVRVSGDLDDPASSSLHVIESSRLVIVQIPDLNPPHNGGTLRFGPDGMLYLSIGEDLFQCKAQEIDSLNGRILRMDVSALPPGGGGPVALTDILPADNPFNAPSDVARLTYCYGLRNPFRFSIDPNTGDLFIGDVGLTRYEEIDRAQGGENFGWPYREGPLVHTWTECQEPGGAGMSAYDAPILSMDRSGISLASVLCGPMYRDAQFPNTYAFPPQYNGDVFIADVFGEWIRRVRRDGDEWVYADSVAGQPDSVNWAEGVVRLADIQVGPEGALYYLIQFEDEIHTPRTGSLRRIAYHFPHVDVEPEQLDFENAIVQPFTDYIHIGSAGTGSFDWSASLAFQSDWISISPLSGRAGDSVAVMIDPRRIPGGIRRDTVIVRSPEAQNPRVAIPVTLTVEGSSTEPRVSPNPFSPKHEVALIQYYVNTPGPVLIEVYDLTAQLVTRFANQSSSPGWNVIEWNGSDAASGVYICRLVFEGREHTLKIVLRN